MEALLKESEEASPYTNEKPNFIIESLENREFLSKFIEATYGELLIKKTRNRQYEKSIGDIREGKKK